MHFAGRDRFGRLATRLATWFAPPLYKRNWLADLNPRGYVDPSAVIDHPNLELGAHTYVGERVKIPDELVTKTQGLLLESLHRLQGYAYELGHAGDVKKYLEMTARVEQRRQA
jgi:hypothetical protein